MTGVVAVFALLVVVFVTQSARVGRAHLTGPIVFVASGIGVGLVLTGGADAETSRTIAEVTLALTLFHDAAQLQPREVRGDSVFTGRLLLVGLPLTIGAGYLLARWIFPGSSVWLALLLAATLAPTDAGLGAATVLNPVVPVRVRRILNVESGLNDGMATPVVLFAVAAAAGAAPEAALVDALRELAIGAVLGILAGYASGRLIERSRRAGWAESALLPVATLSVPVLAYYGAVEAGGNGFVAAFVAGTAYAAAQTDSRHTHAGLELTDRLSALLGFAVWLLFGITVAHHLDWMVRWQSLLYAALSLTALRMLPVALCLVGTGLRRRTVLFVGWFGPRGLASVVFALITYETLGAADPDVQTLIGAVATTVLLSVVLHGLSAGPWAQRYGDWAQRTRPAVETQPAAEPLAVRRSVGGHTTYGPPDGASTPPR
ncbi:cation:proton antiporter [Terrabacter sp. LjRoot27]|uniref:cation:proton antiporter n=1 Tax=Terrabacter sp. LjRoot27 TaxID=3342306 RepID=UPI003ECC3B20